MTRLAAAWSLPKSIERAWPEELRPEDPFSGDEGLADPATYAQYLQWVRPARLSEAVFRAQDAAFLEAYFDVLAGRRPWGATDGPAKALVIDHPLRHDRRPARPAMAPVSDDIICDLTEDWVPSIGLLAPPRVLGPWAILALPPRLRMWCAAVMSFSPVFPPSIRPMSRPGRTKPKVDGFIKSALIAVLRAPMMVWVPTADGGLEPVLPMAERSRPPGLVTGVPNAPAVLGRAVQHPDGWWLACALPLPIVPEPAILQRRLELEYQRLRRHDRRMTWEDILRDRSELLCRTACEWLWVHTPDAVMPLWASWDADWSVSQRRVRPRRKGPARTPAS
ncbi:MAG: hypothetical protein CL927_04730 [Deltaproteobacteria bacterium]|nr:hypothetical protein [Deltaproteobacteria bacterium]HCH61282.1 hypothetical protein [Deltaproteobacteria bacterium]